MSCNNKEMKVLVIYHSPNQNRDDDFDSFFSNFQKLLSNKLM